MIVLLHGFWGAPEDFNPILERLPLGREVWAPDLYEPGPLAPTHGFAEWSENFVASLRARAPVTLVGYSMGARLAMHALRVAPECFERALLVSGSPYYTESVEGERARWESDWAARFRRDPWADLERAWDAQSVFDGTRAPARRHEDGRRELLARSLLNWSARLHRFGREDVMAFAVNVDWAFGALDQKYLGRAKVLQELPVRGQIDIVANAGHRIITDQPHAVLNWLNLPGVEHRE